MHGGHGGGAIHGLMAWLASAFLLGGGLLIGVALDFEKHPGVWIGKFWLPALLVLIGVIGGIMDTGGER